MQLGHVCIVTRVLNGTLSFPHFELSFTTSVISIANIRCVKKTKGFALIYISVCVMWTYMKDVSTGGEGEQRLEGPVWRRRNSRADKGTLQLQQLSCLLTRSIIHIDSISHKLDLCRLRWNVKMKDGHRWVLMLPGRVSHLHTFSRLFFTRIITENLKLYGHIYHWSGVFLFT